ncbi:hypothetical protein WJX73_004850 [Symbiochloris irregularis]|uniref:Uncharacterized protein n=1 Tax=Symbiochloris irregularis TaxID=706552 RepID=A0AAW1PHM8_9CHLO
MALCYRHSVFDPSFPRFSAAALTDPVRFRCQRAPKAQLAAHAFCKTSTPSQQPHSGTARRLILVGPLLFGFAGCASSHARPWVLAILPTEYTKVASKLIGALRASIEADLSDADEREVRKKADPAKEMIRTWVLKWRDDPSVSTDTSHRQITATIQQLGDFYLKKGQRARLPRTFGESLLAKLQAADLALPRQPGSA